MILTLDQIISALCAVYGDIEDASTKIPKEAVGGGKAAVYSTVNKLARIAMMKDDFESIIGIYQAFPDAMNIAGADLSRYIAMNGGVPVTA